MQSNRSRSRNRSTASSSNEPPPQDPDDGDDPEDPPSDLENSFEAELSEWEILALGSPALAMTLHAGPHGPTIVAAANAFGIDPAEIYNAHHVPFLRAARDEQVMIIQRIGDLLPLANQGHAIV